ncbi:6-phosphofructokinase [Candidatus Haliotispira prima]|uniref:6-phosphofructokinase n=1 Tax=Candidatus Haliotispira prima TaxID=3034016 RepID=A0ABY8MJL7_9SPIO|nr:6-phosphofructokinase [Candidatus Haliotispira prima]
MAKQEQKKEREQGAARTQTADRQSPSDRKYRVGIIFSGGPAPAANSVIGACVAALLGHGHECLGFYHGYSNLQDYHPVTGRLLPDKHYRTFDETDLEGYRNRQGIIIGTARSNPGKGIEGLEDLKDSQKTEKLRNVYSALVDLGIDALISIGGDDTLRTANLIVEYQKNLGADHRHVNVIHLPKTIDNDYPGIDFTFGFFTAVDIMAKEALNLRADAQATSAYYIVETMGRKAGWLAYGTAIAGEANMVIGVEDLLCDGLLNKEGYLDVDRLAERMLELIVTREKRYDKDYGTVVLAEGLAERLPPEKMPELSCDDHGHVSLGNVDLSKMLAAEVSARYKKLCGRNKKVTAVQLGYESRCAAPHAFDVMLGSQLGVGGFRAVVEGRDAHMVSTNGQFDITFVPFGEIIAGENLRADVRFVQSGSDFHRLARFLETRVESGYSVGGACTGN